MKKRSFSADKMMKKNFVFSIHTTICSIKFKTFVFCISQLLMKIFPKAKNIFNLIDSFFKAYRFYCGSGNR